MKYFIRSSKGAYKPISSVSNIIQVDGYPNMYDVYFIDSNQPERIMDTDKILKDTFIG